MRPTMIAVLLLAGCGGAEGPAVPEASAPTNPATATGTLPATSPAPAKWRMDSSDEGVALVLADDAGTASLRLSCPAGSDRLVVNVPGFEPVGSEDRLSFGQGGQVEALVAEPGGDPVRGGVTAEGPVPDSLAALLSGAVSASYGAQVSGPHPVPPADMVNAFADACSLRAPVDLGACQTQDGRAIPENRLRAVGTEPFWGARVEGRCVTYSHPEDQEGTRVWTQFSGSAANGTWSGALDGHPFLMRTRPQAGCSDGMSDNRYPIAVTLTVGGEQRSGCAEMVPAGV